MEGGRRDAGGVGHQPGGVAGRRPRQVRAVELVPGDHLAGPGQEVVGGGGGGAVGQREPRRHLGGGVDGADHRQRRPVRPAHRLAEVEQPGALRHRRQPARDRRTQLAPQALVGAELGGVHLGEAAAEVEPGRALGQPGVGEGVELDDLGAGGLQQLHGLGVAEGEGPPARDGDPRPTSLVEYRRSLAGRARHHRLAGRGTTKARLETQGLGRIPRSPLQPRRRRRQAYDPLQVHPLRDLRRQPVERRRGVRPLGRRHQPEVPRRRLDPVVALEDPEHRQLVADRPDDLVGVPRGPRLVEDHPDHVDRAAGPRCGGRGWSRRWCARRTRCRRPAPRAYASRRRRARSRRTRHHRSARRTGPSRPR